MIFAARVEVWRANIEPVRADTSRERNSELCWDFSHKSSRTNLVNHG